MRFLTLVGAVGLMVSGSALAKYDMEVLREGLKDICSDYGGDYWDNGDLIGCEMSDDGASVTCSEDSGCVVDEVERGQPIGGRTRVILGNAAPVKVVQSIRDYCRVQVRDHRPGRPNEVGQKKICARHRLQVGVARP